MPRRSTQPADIAAPSRPAVIALREQEAAEAFGIGLTTFRELVEEGKFPPPTYIRPRIPLYDLEDLRRAWNDLKEAAGNAQDNPWDED